MDNRFCTILHVRTKTLVGEVMCFFGAVKSKGSRTVQSKKADFVKKKKISLERGFFFIIWGRGQAFVSIFSTQSLLLHIMLWGGACMKIVEENEDLPGIQGFLKRGVGGGWGGRWSDLTSSLVFNTLASKYVSFPLHNREARVVIRAAVNLGGEWDKILQKWVPVLPSTVLNTELCFSRFYITS